jgi:hypothetical protein
MTNGTADLVQVRLALQRLKRGTLLIIAESAAELVEPSKLKALLGDVIDIEALAAAPAMAPPCWRTCGLYGRSLAGDYYESFPVHGWNCTERSKGTDAFMATFDRLLDRCIRGAETGPRRPVLGAFDLRFELLRHIDEGHDDVIFFADEGGSYEVGVDWRSALPAYFRCLADCSSAEQFAKAVNQVITDFADHDRARHLAEACRVADDAQRVAVREFAGGHAPG